MHRSEISDQIDHKGPNCTFLTLKMTFRVIPVLIFLDRIAFTPKKLHEAINLDITSSLLSIRRIGVFAQGQILCISPNGLQDGHCDAPPPHPILDDQKLISIAFLAISDKYATFYFCISFSQNGCRRPFWMTEMDEEELVYLPKGKYCVYPRMVYRMAIVMPPPPTPFWMTKN